MATGKARIPQKAAPSTKLWNRDRPEVTLKRDRTTQNSRNGNSVASLRKTSVNPVSAFMDMATSCTRT
ncbi:hypothetical protein D3C72_2600880 [compost metagenome]